MKILLIFFLLLFSPPLISKEYPVSLFSINLFELKSKHLVENAEASSTYNDTYYNYDEEYISSIEKNDNFEHYSIVTDKKKYSFN